MQNIKAIEMPGFDNYGNPYTAPVLTHQAREDQAASITHTLGANQQKAMKLLRALMQEAEQDAMPGAPIRVKVNQWRNLCEEVGIDRRRWTEVSNSLMSRKLLTMESGNVQLCE